ncbi:MAG: ATP-binding protein [Bacillota bacterium]
MARPQAHQLVKSDARTILESAVKVMKPEANLINVKIELEVEESLPSITCDPNQIKQVFINLVKNSIEAMPSGGVVKMKANQENSCLILKVIDEGIGLSQDRIETLGEPFYSNKEKGIGLGLMVNYRIIHNHNGTITVSSERDKGTTVEVRLPIG